MKPKKTYYIYAKAFDRAGNYTDSEEVTVQTLESSITYLIQNGRTLVDWNEYYQNHTSGSIKQEEEYISFYTGGSNKFSNYHTKVDLTNISKIYFYGKISSTNPSSGHFFVSTSDKTDSTNTNHGGQNEGIEKYIQLSSKLDQYEIDVSELVGEHYIGVFGSSRTISIYDIYYDY